MSMLVSSFDDYDSKAFTLAFNLLRALQNHAKLRIFFGKLKIIWEYLRLNRSKVHKKLNFPTLFITN